jgi:hypothetical protein
VEHGSRIANQWSFSRLVEIHDAGRTERLRSSMARGLAQEFHRSWKWLGDQFELVG